MGNMLYMMLVTTLLGPWSLTLGACKGGAGPSDQAIQSYLGASDATMDPKTPPAAAQARRVSLTVESGAGLEDVDDGPGETDPYVIVEFEGVRFETSVVEGSLDPVWGDSFVFDVVPGGTLTVSLMDEDFMASDEKMGVVSQPLPPITIGERATLIIPFRNGEHGTVTITLLGLDRS